MPEEAAEARPEGHLGLKNAVGCFSRADIGVTGGSLASQNELKALGRCLLAKIKL